MGLPWDIHGVIVSPWESRVIAMSISMGMGVPRDSHGTLVSPRDSYVTVMEHLPWDFRDIPIGPRLDFHGNQSIPMNCQWTSPRLLYEVHATAMFPWGPMGSPARVPWECTWYFHETSVGSSPEFP